MWCTLSEGIFLLTAVLATLFFWLSYHYGYWLRHKVPQIEPTFLVGNLSDLLHMRKSSAEFIQELYNHPQAVGKPFVGIHVFHRPALLVRHPELVKRVLIKDFSKFCNRYSNSDYNGDPLGSRNIFFLKNPAWKEVRLRLSPFFTSARIKKMVHLIVEVGNNLDAYLLKHSLDSDESQSFCLEMKEFCALYTTDVIATVAYGVEANSFNNPNGDFRRNGRQVFRFSTTRAVIFAIVFFLPDLMPYFGLKVVPPQTTEFLRSTVKYVMEQRELSGKFRNDLIDILIEYKTWSKAQALQGKGDFVFEGDLLVAQAAIFFTAGFETSSATMSFALYELAKHLDVQQRVREEIRQALIENDGKVSLSLIDSLEYTQLMIYEVLRLYPPLPFLDRECTVDEDSRYSLAPFSEFSVPRGMPVYVPVYGLHMDPNYFPNPEVFDPNRFTPGNKKQFTPHTYMPFGLGPHGCIGERFAYLQIKIGLVNFFRHHYVTTCDKTRLQMKLDPRAIIVQAQDGIYLNVVRDPLNI